MFLFISLYFLQPLWAINHILKSLFKTDKGEEGGFVFQSIINCIFIIPHRDICHVYQNLLRSDVERRMRVPSVQSRPYNLEDLSWNSSHTSNEEVSPFKYRVRSVRRANIS